MTRSATTRERPAIAVPSRALGTIEVRSEDVVTMIEPMAGFPGCRGYALVDHLRDDGAPNATVRWLQAVEPPFHAFVVADPWVAFPDYAPEIADADAGELGLRSLKDARILVVLTVSPSGGITVNLRAPVLVNRLTGAAKQVVLPGEEYHTRHALTAGG